MSEVETTQLRIRLTNDKKILNQMRKNKVLRKDAKGEVFTRQFDSKVFEFRPGVILTVGKRVGKAMIRDSAIIIDDHLTGEMVPCVEELGQYELGMEVSPEESEKATRCPICKQDCHTIPRLARHLLSKHKADRADLFEAEDAETEQSLMSELGPQSAAEVEEDENTSK